MTWQGHKVAPDHLTDEQRDQLGGAAPLMRGNIWGNARLMLSNQTGVGGAAANLEQFLEVGPLEEPVELLIGGSTDFIGVGAVFEARLTIGVGKASFETVLQNFLPPFVVVAQSLRVSIRRTDAVIGAPNPTLRLFCSVRISGATPVIFSSEALAFGAAIAVLPMSVPANATHVKVARNLNSTAIQLEETIQGTVQSSELFKAILKEVTVPLDPSSTLTQMRRSPTVLAVTNVAQYLR
jgi:hypothetical protein